MEYHQSFPLTAIDEYKAFFRANGYVVIENALSPSEVQDTLEEVYDMNCQSLTLRCGPTLPTWPATLTSNETIPPLGRILIGPRLEVDMAFCHRLILMLFAKLG